MSRATEVAVMPCCRRKGTNVLLGREPKLQLASKDAEGILKQSPRKKSYQGASAPLVSQCRATPRTPISDARSVLEAGGNDPTDSAAAPCLATRYLPMQLNGTKVMVLTSSKKFRADNSELKAPTAGLVFRSSKRMDDWDSDADFLAWGDVISAADEGDGWIRCQVLKQESSAPRVTFHDAGSTLASARSLQKSRLGAEERAAKFSKDVLEKLAALPINHRSVLKSPIVQASDLTASTSCSDEDDRTEYTFKTDDSSSCCSLDILD